MYLIDTNVISEARKRERADAGVREFLTHAAERDEPLFLSAITIGELRRGVELVRRRGDRKQAESLEAWLRSILAAYADRVLPFDAEAGEIWGRLRAENPEPALNKQIAAIALINDLTLVTRNARDFVATGVKALNPFVS
jgi:hypothetical protein